VRRVGLAEAVGQGLDAGDAAARGGGGEGFLGLVAGELDGGEGFFALDALELGGDEGGEDGGAEGGEEIARGGRGADGGEFRGDEGFGVGALGGCGFGVDVWRGRWLVLGWEVRRRGGLAW
jgi:hypothetical protein